MASRSTITTTAGEPPTESLAEPSAGRGAGGRSGGRSRDGGAARVQVPAGLLGALRARGAAGLAAGLAAGAVAGCGIPAFGGSGESDTGTGAPVPSGAAAECPRVGPPPASSGRDLRAMWIATVGNIDWPKNPRASADEQKKQYVRLLDTAAAMHMNAVFVQIRPNSDAFYPSPYEPWSQWITGTQGKDPGYDVLAFMLKEAHARNLEFHAWFNPYRVSRQDDLKKLSPKSPARQHPDWTRKYGGGLWYDPGLPQVRDLVTNAVLDVVRKYDIDAVHFDDYFYPYPEGGEFPDAATHKTYGAGMSKGDWRRANVNTLVQSLSKRIHDAKPWVRFGISPFGVWRNKSTDPAGSPTSALQSHDDIYADTRTWIKKGWLDYVTPQLYWPIGDPRADYAKLVAWWAAQVKGTRVQLTIGQAAYRVGENATWRNPAELSRHLTLNAKYPQVRGDVFFSASDIAANRRGFAARIRADHYARPALRPVVEGRGGAAPPAVQNTSAAPADGGQGGDGVKDVKAVKGLKVTWRASEGAASYAVYRVDGKGPACAAVRPADLIADVRGGGIVDPSAKPGRTYTYYVTALDRLGHQSGPARGATATAPQG
ncbi:glycoside hydrolase family 10 protein [Actinomadura decatromicini]|uniref:Family 10 glycosylhydrolase n=1 Tax=Actinomadura decatromicini TaxID=2604572 RepID=A0A5D3FAI5_9ACTN|nr:family 10 glycosylhydrolase [Actinomadura decatromicini]TYK44958.1 family 10 glycosylhydrolase [Actinomadura decatromicini]